MDRLWITKSRCWSIHLSVGVLHTDYLGGLHCDLWSVGGSGRLPLA